MRKLYTLVGAATILVGGACAGDLDVTNPNNPDIKRALASPEDVKQLAISSVNSWYLTSSHYEPFAFGSVTADAHTANFGNFGMRFNNLEPRIAYENNSAGGDRDVARRPWDNHYGTLGAANDAIRALTTGGVVIPGAGETEKHKQLAMFSQAASLMNLALWFDKAFVVDEATDVIAAPPVLKPYAEVSAAAVAKWDALIAASATQSFTYASTVIPLTGGLTSSRLNRIANTMAAMTMAYTPRNAAQAAAVNWAKVATLTDKGIGTGSAGAPFDMTVVGDNTNWYSYIVLYGNLHSWMRIDHRLINRMDGTTAPKYDGTVQPKGTSPDARYTSDFYYCEPGTGTIRGTTACTARVIGAASRGIWMQSHWFHYRYVEHSFNSATSALGPAPFILAAESDLLRAEALIRSGGSKATAVSLINNTRVTRGNLTAALATESDAALLDKIDYEREVELATTNGLELQRARIRDRVQVGTARHLPIPAKELETLGLPIYTFGGPGKELNVSPVGTSLLGSFSTERFPRRTGRLVSHTEQ